MVKNLTCINKIMIRRPQIPRYIVGIIVVGQGIRVSYAGTPWIFNQKIMGAGNVGIAVNYPAVAHPSSFGAIDKIGGLPSTGDAGSDGIPGKGIGSAINITKS